MVRHDLCLQYDAVTLQSGESLPLPDVRGILCLETMQKGAWVQAGGCVYPLMPGKSYLWVEPKTLLSGSFLGNIRFFAAI